MSRQLKSALDGSSGVPVFFWFLLWWAALCLKEMQLLIAFPKQRKSMLFWGPLSSQRAGLSVTNAKILYDQVDAQDMMVVSGDLTNSSSQVKPIPPLKLKLVGEEFHPKCGQASDKKACVVDEWDHHLSESFLLPGETIHFETHPRSKVEGIHDVSVEF